MRIKGKNILLGITGGVAIYKSLEVIRQLTTEGANCQAIMTRSATQMVRPELFEAITGRRVAADLWESDRDFRPAEAFGPETRPIHIDMAQSADFFLVTPATANVMAKMAAGIADDLLTTSYLAATCPVAVAPAMNKFMWLHESTQRNLRTLRADGVLVVPPESGDLACGYEGVGRVAEPETQVAFVIEQLGREGGDLAGKRVLVTAGRTEEAIDPVRILTNRSSGRMGCAIAREAARRGAEVTMVHGALSVALPEGIRAIEARSVSAMAEAVRREAAKSDIVIMAAAVGDFRPSKTSESKQKRKGPITLDLEPTEDILASIGSKRNGIEVLVGFALETDDIEKHGRAKLEKKGLDLIVVNRPHVNGGGIDQDATEAVILGANGTREEIPLAAKSEIARKIIDQVNRLLAGK